MLISKHKDKHLYMSLTDHHRITNLYTFLYEKCNEYPKILHIIDHHQVSEDQPISQPLLFSDIRKIGSASTIVSEIIIHFYSKDSSSIIIDENIITLLLSAMIIDQSNNFKIIDHITTMKDIQIFNILITLSSKLDLNDEKYRNEYYNKIKELKSDISDLSSLEMMNKDYKEWNDVYYNREIKYGISSMVISIGEWYKKDKDLINEMIKFYNDNKLDLYITNHMYKKRRILILSKDQLLVKELSEYIYNSPLLYEKGSIKEISKVINNLIQSNNKVKMINDDKKDDKYTINDIKIKYTATRKVLQPEIHSYFQTTNK